MIEEQNNTELDTDNQDTDNQDTDNQDTDNQDTVVEEETYEIKDYKEKLSTCEDKLQRILADYQNLERRSKTEISQKVTLKINQIILGFIGIYEDFIRAKSALKDEGINVEGLDGVIKNMESLLSENNIKPIDAVGEIFDPKLHEAVSTTDDNSLDEGTITQEVAKGYISFQDVIRPSKVIVSKKNKEE